MDLQKSRIAQRLKREREVSLVFFFDFLGAMLGVYWRKSNVYSNTGGLIFTPVKAVQYAKKLGIPPKKYL